MSDSQLPERASLEYLKKLAKDRLQQLRRADPNTKLAAALLAVARDYGFSSWRALKAEVEQRQTNQVDLFLEASSKGDLESLRGFAGLARAANASGWTGLHAAARGGHLDAVRLLLQHGADPNAREAGDNTTALHWAAAGGRLEIVRTLLDAGGDVHGVGDLHEFDVIGWATYYHPAGAEVAALLIERGARHHIFSAISLGDLEVIRKLVEDKPGALDRRMSRFEQRQTPLHFAMNLKRYDILDLLIELGADLEAVDQSNQTALGVAMLRGDSDAMRRLAAAGAQQPATVPTASFSASMAELSASVRKIIPMIKVADVKRSLEWYTSIGFKETARYEDGGLVNFGLVAFGNGELMLNMHGKAGPQSASLWFYTNQVDQIYQLLRSRQIAAAQATLAGGPGKHEGIEFVEDINDPFYGGRQFAVRDPDGYEIYFIQPEAV